MVYFYDRTEMQLYKEYEIKSGANNLFQNVKLMEMQFCLDLEDG